jgi:hypothetical protein
MFGGLIAPSYEKKMTLIAFDDRQHAIAGNRA